MGLGLLGGPGDLVIKYVVSSRVVSNILNRFPKWSYPNYSITCNRLTKSPGPPSRLWGLFAVYIYIYMWVYVHILYIYIWVNIYIYIYTCTYRYYSVGDHSFGAGAFQRLQHFFCKDPSSRSSVAIEQRPDSSPVAPFLELRLSTNGSNFFSFDRKSLNGCESLDNH